MKTYRLNLFAIAAAVTVAPACALISFPSQPRACGAFVQASHKQTVQQACHEETASSQRLVSPGNYTNGTCHVFVIHAAGRTRQTHERKANVAKLLRQYPDIRIMSAIMWRDDWETVEAIFKALQIPVCFFEKQICGQPQWGRGKYANWASLILAYAYQIRFGLPCMMLLEDDVYIQRPQLFDQKRAAVPNSNKPWFHKCGRWGECYMTNLAGATSFIESVYKYGVTQHSDWHVIWNLKHTKDSWPYFWNCMVKTNDGDINFSPPCNVDSFNYTPIDVPQVDRLLRIFDAGDENNPVVDFPKLARKGFLQSVKEVAHDPAHGMAKGAHHRRRRRPRF